MMITEINKKLKEIFIKKKQLKLINASLMELNGRMHQKTLFKKRATKILEQEFKDFKRISGWTLTALFNLIIGKKEEKINKEKQEYLLAKLNYDQLTEEILLIESDIKKKKKEAIVFLNIDFQYKKILKEKETYLREVNDVMVLQLNQIDEVINHIEVEIKELNEAILASEPVIEILKEVIDTLKLAEKWGRRDIRGGGMITTYIKHSKINMSKDLIGKVQFHIDNFVREMKDVNANFNINAVNLSQYASFSDFFFDGLIIDYFVQKQIKQSKSHAESTFSSFSDIKAKLSYKRDQKQLVLKRRNKDKISLLSKL
jgi:hypothetical protein